MFLLVYKIRIRNFGLPPKTNLSWLMQNALEESMELTEMQILHYSTHCQPFMENLPLPCELLVCHKCQESRVPYQSL